MQSMLGTKSTAQFQLSDALGVRMGCNSCTPVFTLCLISFTFSGVLLMPVCLSGIHIISTLVFNFVGTLFACLRLYSCIHPVTQTQCFICLICSDNCSVAECGLFSQIYHPPVIYSKSLQLFL